MATYYCDTTLASGNNDGTTFDHAYRTIKAAMERTLTTGDILWIRRASSEEPTADITPAAASDATVASPIRIIGWPRNTLAITSSDWTNGSTTVTIDDDGMSRGHLGRYITSPSGRKYLITLVTNGTTITIDREYAGATVTNQAATIHADEDYAEAQAIDDSAWTIKKATWNADAATLPVIDFGTGVFNVNITGTNGPWVFANLDFLNGRDTNGMLNIESCLQAEIIGCLFLRTENYVTMLRTQVTTLIQRVIMSGAGTGGGRALNINNNDTRLQDVAIYGASSNGIHCSNGRLSMQNVNIGVEIANTAADIRIDSTITPVSGIDVKLGGTNGLFLYSPISVDRLVNFENYGKILGANYSSSALTDVMLRKAVVAGSGDPYKRSGGADDVLAINRFASATQSARPPGMEVLAAEWRFWADTSSKSYRVYCQQVAMSTLTAAQAFIEATYVCEYDDSTEYDVCSVKSDETIAVRSGADDWSQYLEVTGVQPAVAGWVTIRLMVQWYDADGYLYVDPLVVVS